MAGFRLARCSVAVLASTWALTVCPLRAESGDSLRAAWVLHRLQGQSTAARTAYLAIYEDAALPADSRCRAAIGIGLVEREAGEEKDALEWFERASTLPGAGPRWVKSALEQIGAIQRSLESESDPRASQELASQVSGLEEDVAAFRTLIDEQDQELSRRDAIIQRLRESDAGEEKALNIQAEIHRNRAAQFLESIAEQEKEAQRVSRHFAGAAIGRAIEHLGAGRVLFAYNEVKRALEIDPLNRRAQDLEARCRGVMAEGTSEGVIPRASSASVPVTRPELVVEVMSAYLDEGKRLYRKGRIVGAIGAFERVIEEYANSAVALTDEQLSTIVAPAEHYLRGCYEDRGVAAETLRLRARRSDLLAEVEAGAKRILEQQQALEEIDSSLERIRDRNPEEGIRLAASAAEAQMRAGLEAMENGRSREARVAFRDVRILLEWFPSLDPEQRLLRKVSELIQEIEAIGTGTE